MRLIPDVGASYLMTCLTTSGTRLYPISFVSAYVNSHHHIGSFPSALQPRRSCEAVNFRGTDRCYTSRPNIEKPNRTFEPTLQTQHDLGHRLFFMQVTASSLGWSTIERVCVTMKADELDSAAQRTQSFLLSKYSSWI